MNTVFIRVVILMKWFRSQKLLLLLRLTNCHPSPWGKLQSFEHKRDRCLLTCRSHANRWLNTRTILYLWWKAFWHLSLMVLFRSVKNRAKAGCWHEVWIWAIQSLPSVIRSDKRVWLAGREEQLLPNVSSFTAFRAVQSQHRNFSHRQAGKRLRGTKVLWNYLFQAFLN